MARSHLTLAALATSAVTGLRVMGSGPLGHGATGDFDSALLRTDDDRELVVRIANNEQAASDQSVELIALQAMSAGIRSRLPFEVPTVLGQATSGGVRAVVYDFLPGYNLDDEHLPAGDGAASSIGAAIAAIHALPGGFVSEVGLPHLSAAECRSEARNVIERAAATRLLPTAVKRRWLDAASDENLWQFQPTVINGSVRAESFILTDHEVGPIVTGAIGWHALRVGDPALDLHWVSGAGEAAESVIASYRSASPRNPDRLIAQRAMLHAELELARWLLHGVDTKDQETIDDAVSLLDGLVDHVLGDLMHPLTPQTGPIMAVTEVEDLLTKTPHTEQNREAGSAIAMETDSYSRSELEQALSEEGIPAEIANDDEAAPDAGRRDDSAADAKPSEAEIADPGERPHFTNTDAIETGPIEIVADLVAETAAKVRAEKLAQTAELDFSVLEAAESGEVTPLIQRSRNSASE